MDFFMQRRERRELKKYRNAKLMKALNEWCIHLKIWLYPEKFGENLKDMQRYHLKPDSADFDLRHYVLNEALERYHSASLIREVNVFCADAKIFLYKEEIQSLSALRWHRTKPTIEYFDDLFYRVYAELEKDSESMRKY